MAFDKRRLQLLARAGSHTFWHYRLLEDELAQAFAEPGYFNLATGALSGGDTVMMTGPDGGALFCVTTPAGDQGVRLARFN